MILNPTEQTIAIYATLYMVFLIGLFLMVKDWSKKPAKK